MICPVHEMDIGDHPWHNIQYFDFEEIPPLHKVKDTDLKVDYDMSWMTLGLVPLDQLELICSFKGHQ